MERRIGTMLREARHRRGIEIAEVETATKIRARYLLAIENEDWGALPGGVYTRGFIRAYASFLGLDGERLVGEYRRSVEEAGDDGGAVPGQLQPVETVPAPALGRGRSTPRVGWLAASAVLLLAAIAIFAIPGGDGGNEADVSSPGQAGERPDRSQEQPRVVAEPTGRGVSVRLSASDEVWVCVLDARGRELVDGQILEAGAEAGPFRSGSFTVSFGNGGVSMLIDGREAEIPATASPIGYSVDATGSLTELGETERPTCV